MDGNTAGVIALGILIGIPSLTMAAVSITRMLIEHKESGKR